MYCYVWKTVLQILNHKRINMNSIQTRLFEWNSEILQLLSTIIFGQKSDTQVSGNTVKSAG